jgi:hypothetical protein
VTGASTASFAQKEEAMPILLWLLGVPVSLIILLMIL